MPKVKLTTTMDKDVLKKVKIRAVEEELTIGEMLGKVAMFYLDCCVDVEDTCRKNSKKKNILG